MHKVIAKIDLWIGLPFFVNLFMAMHLDIILSALINFFSFGLSPVKYLVNSLASVLVVGFYVFFMIFVIRQSMRLEKHR